MLWFIVRECMITSTVAFDNALMMFAYKSELLPFDLRVAINKP